VIELACHSWVLQEQQVLVGYHRDLRFESFSGLTGSVLMQTLIGSGGIVSH
jgi:hypothetical protein